jgi:subtilisin family serine protease
VSSFSDSASFLTLLAPGQYIYSSVPGGGFATMMGTSMATPHVAGAWAVLKFARPSATVDQTLYALSATGKPITDPRNGITKPRIRLNTAADLLIDLGTYFFPVISK